MRCKIKISLCLILMSLITITGCKKNKEEEIKHYKVSVSGNTYEDFDFNYDYIIDDIWFAGPYEHTLDLQCVEGIYYTTLQMELAPRVSLWIVIKKHTDDGTLPTGTYSCDTVSCNAGFHGTLLGSSENWDTAYELELSASTVTVTMTSELDKVYPETYNVVINATIDPESGGGTISGNFSGKIYGVDFCPK